MRVRAGRLSVRGYGNAFRSDRPVHARCAQKIIHVQLRGRNQFFHADVIRLLYKRHGKIQHASVRNAAVLRQFVIAYFVRFVSAPLFVIRSHKGKGKAGHPRRVQDFGRAVGFVKAFFAGEVEAFLNVFYNARDERVVVGEQRAAHVGQFCGELLLIIVYVKEFFRNDIRHNIMKRGVNGSRSARNFFRFVKGQRVIQVFVRTFHRNNA